MDLSVMRQFSLHNQSLLLQQSSFSQEEINSGFFLILHDFYTKVAVTKWLAYGAFPFIRMAAYNL